MIDVVNALKAVSDTQLENDKALLKLCEALVERVMRLEERIEALEAHVVVVQDGLTTALISIETLLKKVQAYEVHDTSVH